MKYERRDDVHRSKPPRLGVYFVQFWDGDGPVALADVVSLEPYHALIRRGNLEDDDVCFLDAAIGMGFVNWFGPIELPDGL